MTSPQEPAADPEPTQKRYADPRVKLAALAEHLERRARATQGGLVDSELYELAVRAWEFLASHPYAPGISVQVQAAEPAVVDVEQLADAVRAEIRRTSILNGLNGAL